MVLVNAVGNFIIPQGTSTEFVRIAALRHQQVTKWKRKLLQLGLDRFNCLYFGKIEAMDFVPLTGQAMISMIEVRNFFLQ